MLFLLMFAMLSYFELNAQEIVEEATTTTLPHNSLSLIYAKGKINFALENLNFSAQFEAKIVGEDSAVISIFGPMNVLLAKAYSSRYYFVYYDILNNWAVTGIPTSEKIFEAAQIPLGFVDLVRLFKAELLYPKDSLKNTILENGKTLLSYKSSNFVDFFLFDETNKIVQYQKKNFEGNIVLNITYPEYLTIENYQLPKKYVMLVEKRKGYISIETEKVSLDFDISMPFCFQVPKSVEMFRYE